MEPISEEEVSEAIRTFKAEMSPNADMRGCACCGVRIILISNKQPNKMPVSSLHLLRLPAEEEEAVS